MEKLDMNLLFPPRGGSRKFKKINYDVRITSNNSGNETPRIRFAFYNKAAQVFRSHDYIEFSDLEYRKDRIYFRLYDGEKPHKRTSKVNFNSKSKQDCCYGAITPATDKAEKIYRRYWVNENFNLLYDEENELYYIEKTKEEKTNA